MLGDLVGNVKGRVYPEVTLWKLKHTLCIYVTKGGLDALHFPDVTVD